MHRNRSPSSLGLWQRNYGLAKALARRIENVLPPIIYSDQTGAIKTRHSFTNMWRLNVIHTLAHLSHLEIVISLNAEKAFNHIEWGHLFFTLKQFGFGD